MNDGTLLIYLTSRDRARGEQALKDLLNDPHLREAKVLHADGGLADIKFHDLDISQTESIQDFALFLKNQHPDGIDFVINNAAIALQGFDTEVVRKTLQCNYYGTLEVTQTFLPLIRDGGRVVNVSSTGGKLYKLSPRLQEMFRAARSTNDITALMESFKSAVAAGREEEQGWQSAAYGTSKTGVTAMTRCIADEWKAKGSNILINACCPGFVKACLFVTLHKQELLIPSRQI